MKRKPHGINELPSYTSCSLAVLQRSCSCRHTPDTRAVHEAAHEAAHEADHAVHHAALRSHHNICARLGWVQSVRPRTKNHCSLQCGNAIGIGVTGQCAKSARIDHRTHTHTHRIRMRMDGWSGCALSVDAFPCCHPPPPGWFSFVRAPVSESSSFSLPPFLSPTDRLHNRPVHGLLLVKSLGSSTARITVS